MRDLSLAIAGALAFHLFLLGLPLIGLHDQGSVPQAVARGRDRVTIRLATVAAAEPRVAPAPVRPHPGSPPPVKPPEAEVRQGDMFGLEKNMAKKDALQGLAAHTMPADKRGAASPPVAAAQGDEHGVGNGPSRGLERAEAEAGKGLALAVHRPSPPYPVLARRRGWQGRVVLALVLAGDGTVVEAAVHTGCGHRILDEAALAAVRAWRFQADVTAKGGRQRRVVVPITFRLEK